MLLPSDVARLVLGYLQQEGLIATSRAFIYESPNLKEYAEHSSEDGIIPACVFSLFGKNLITILNEYVAVKAKETCQENQIPAVMTSLWKKLDFTLNQIKSLQNSPAVQLNQRLRTRNGIQNMRRQQRPLLEAQSPISGHPSLTPAGHCVPNTVSTPQGLLGHSTPVSYSLQHTRPSTLCLTQPGESPLQILVPENRFNPGPLSPARRKCDSPRRRGGGQLGASGICRTTVASSTLIVEAQSEENMTENLSQIVIENARERILNDRSLQEKLAENINKILASDNSPQISKAACSTVEQEQSIDEILGLQGEIHMTDDAIQDILTHTESDPAFQALFDLFDCGKGKMAEGGEQADGSFSTSTSAQESDETGQVDSASEVGPGQEDSASRGESSSRILSTQSTFDSKCKKKSTALRNLAKSSPTAPQPRILTRQTAQGATNSKRGLTRTRVVSGNKQSRGTNLTSPRLNEKADSRPPDQTVSSSSFTEEGMEVDQPQNETSEIDNVQDQQLVAPGSSHANEILSDIASSQDLMSNKMPQTTLTSETSDNASLNESVRETEVQHMGSSLAIQSEAVPSLPLPAPDVDTFSKSSSPSSNTTLLAPSCTQTGTQQPSRNGLAIASSATTPITSSCVSDAHVREPDPSKIVSLKIVVSDEQEELSTDVALSQAVSSITSDHIPTIFLSSPAKSPAKILPATPTVMTQEETAQAVSCLQGAEGVGSFGTPMRSMQNNGQTALARPTGQEAGFIQLMQTNPTFGPSGGYFVVTDPTEQRSNVMLLPSNVSQAAVSSMPHVVATPPRQRTVVSVGPNVSQTYSPGSTIIISSPVPPMLQNVMLPVSVMGQNTGKLTVLPNQMLTFPCSTTVRQPAKVISKHKLAPKENTDMSKSSTSASGKLSKPLPQMSEQQLSASGTSPGHRRILCFDVTPENAAADLNSLQTCTLTPSVATSSPTQKEITPNESQQTLASDAGKRRIETTRLPGVNPNAAVKVSEKITIFHQQKEAQKTVKGTGLVGLSSKSANKVASKPESISRSESTKKSHALQKEDGAGLSQSSKSSAPGPKQKPTGNTRTKDSTQEQLCERKLSKPVEKTSLQVSPGVTANKENELESCHHQTSSLPTEDLVSSAAKCTAPVSSGSSKTLCKTSPLTKQAAEMLQDMQGQAPTATTPKRQVPGCPDIPLPRTPGPGRVQEEPTEGLRTPSRQRLRREGEITPRHLPPPATPEMPSCSPASEAGSENSINMAAHTLMILSRAARTGGPLKDSLRQEEASAGKSSIPKGKKRKHSEPSPLAKKELQLSSSSSSKKKSKKQKKLLDSFPDDLDVDKFLSSLHYDE